VGLALAGIGSGASLGSHLASAGGAIVPAVPSTSVLGTPTAGAGAVTLTPAGIPTSAGLGTPSAAAGTVTLAPAGIGTSSALGMPAAGSGILFASVPGIPATRALGTPGGAVAVSAELVALLTGQGRVSTSMAGIPRIATTLGVQDV
jgi:hypothetical protein